MLQYGQIATKCLFLVSILTAWTSSNNLRRSLGHGSSLYRTDLEHIGISNVEDGDKFYLDAKKLNIQRYPVSNCVEHVIEALEKS